jgi:peptidoglycan hydrolase-like protein with peptidoglycan-binding domain
MHGARLLAHELSHVVQQSQAGATQGPLSVGAVDDAYEQEAHVTADRVMQTQAVQVQRSVGHSLQRELATPEPAVAPAAQPDLTDEQIQQAIAYNRTRYNAANTRLIQNLLGGPVTGEWTEENIQAIAANQEIYGLTKDGKVGDETFRFLNREARLEGMSASTANCLTMFRVVGPDVPTFSRVDGSHCQVDGHFRTESQFSSRCNCSQFQFRQFIRGHFTRNRGGTITDISSIFSRLPSGSLTAAFQEDGDTTDTPVNYGHRDQPADNDPVDHYINNAGDDDQANGCRYLSEDGPNATINDCRAGDIYDVDMNFRGEIQRSGTAIQQKFWTAFRNNNWRP